MMGLGSDVGEDAAKILSDKVVPEAIAGLNEALGKVAEIIRPLSEAVSKIAHGAKITITIEFPGQP